MGDTFILGEAALGVYSTIKSSDEEEKMLNNEMAQERVAADERTIQNIEKLKKINATQVAMQGASGLKLSSPSFTANELQSFSNFAKQERVDKLNTNLQLSALENKKQNVEQTEPLGIASNLVDAASNFEKEKRLERLIKRGQLPQFGGFY